MSTINVGMAEDMTVENQHAKIEDIVLVPADETGEFPVNLNGHSYKRPENGTHSYGFDADIPLEATEAGLSPQDFESFEKDILIECLGFSSEEAGKYCERYAHTYYNGTRKTRDNVSKAIHGAFEAFLPSDPEPDEEIEV